MDNLVKEDFVQKRLMYRCDSSLERIFSQYWKHLFPCDLSVAPTLTRQALLSELDELQFQNWKYRAALCAADKDIIHNQAMILSQQVEIMEVKENIDSLFEELKKSQIEKRNKIQFNQIGKLIMNFQKNQIFDSKLMVLENQIKEIQNKYQKDMEMFQRKQRHLKNSLASLKHFFNQFKTNNKNPQQTYIFGDNLEEEGIIQ